MRCASATRRWWRGGEAARSALVATALLATRPTAWLPSWVAAAGATPSWVAETSSRWQRGTAAMTRALCHGAGAGLCRDGLQHRRENRVKGSATLRAFSLGRGVNRAAPHHDTRGAPLRRLSKVQCRICSAQPLLPSVILTRAIDPVVVGWASEWDHQRGDSVRSICTHSVEQDLGRGGQAESAQLGLRDR